ncbi:PRAME family member 12-like isoform X2 [Castor canadensis]|uniref:PRAME family member 12-like isoform X2 n=1 Tax=Castor canadensis TaxID=51338 RepID=A0AC58N6W9_CASCN
MPTQLCPHPKYLNVRCFRSFRMSMKVPPTLLQLAGQSLLRNEALALSALEKLPMELFPPLFMEALTRRHTEVVKAMVQAWPFSCLPLGALMKTRDLETLQITLDGIDMLLSEQIRPRRWKLQVLDLRTAHQNFWNVWSGAMAEYWAPQAKSRNQAEEVPPWKGVKQPLRLIVDLNLELDDLDELQIYLFEWVQQRKSSIQLCCRKMQIWGLCTCGSRAWPIHRVLGLLELDCMEEVVVHCPWTLCALGMFAPYLGQMRNLCKLRISQICVSENIDPDNYKQLVATFTSQFSKLGCLRKLCMSSAYFLHGHLHQVLSCLEAPLESLSITHCLLEESDLQCLSNCLSIHQLKHLSLRGVMLTHVCPEPLQILLHRVADTLKTLDLEDCGIRDSQLTALLPALSHCSQLTTFSFFGNRISMSVLKDLLHQTARLSQLSQELYPAPLESYGGLGAVRTGKVSQHCAELMDTLRARREPRVVLFGIDPCPQCGNRCVYNMEGILRCYWMAA